MPKTSVIGRVIWNVVFFRAKVLCTRDLRACSRVFSCILHIYRMTQILFCRKSRRAVLEENDQKESKRKRSESPVVVTQVIRQDYDQIPEQETEEIKTRKIMDPLNSRLSPKVTPITDDYEISNHVLGLGINGKVVQCYDRNTRQKYALKVSG